MGQSQSQQEEPNESREQQEYPQTNDTFMSESTSQTTGLRRRVVRVTRNIVRQTPYQRPTTPANTSTRENVRTTTRTYEGGRLRVSTVPNVPEHYRIVPIMIVGFRHQEPGDANVEDEDAAAQLLSDNQLIPIPLAPSQQPNVDTTENSTPDAPNPNPEEHRQQIVVFVITGSIALSRNSVVFEELDGQIPTAETIPAMTHVRNLASGLISHVMAARAVRNGSMVLAGANLDRDSAQTPPSSFLNSMYDRVFRRRSEPSEPEQTLPRNHLGNLLGEIMHNLQHQGVSKEDIDKNLSTTSAKNVGEDDLLSSCGQSCLICMQAYEEEEEVRVLTCKHGFHKECVDQWLTKGHNSCPICRKPAVVGENVPESKPPSRAADAVSRLIDVLVQRGVHGEVLEGQNAWRGPFPALVEGASDINGAGIMYVLL